MSCQNIPSLQFRSLIICSAVIIFELLLQLPLQSAPKLPPIGDRKPFDGDTAGGGTRWRQNPKTTINESAEPTGGSFTAPSSTGMRIGLSACTEQNQAPLTALMPNNNVATTVAAHPTFFFYVPKTTAKSLTGEFVLVDEQKKQVYKTTLALTGNSGIINLSLPTSKSLEVGTTYHWQFTLICNPQDPSNDDVELVKGAIKRTELSADIKNQIAQAAPLEQAKLYVDAGIWYETVVILFQLRNSRPDEWSEFLKSVGLDAIASAPFLPTDDYAF